MHCEYRGWSKNRILTSPYSIAKYTEDYSHLERCTPSLPDPTDPATPIEEYKGLESPRQYYATVADSIPPPQTARLPSSPSIHTMDRLPNMSMSPRPRASSSALYQTQSHPDTHISGHEPRAFPGLIHQRERRKSLRVSTSNSDMTGGPDMSSSLQLEPGLAKITLKEDRELAQEENSD